MNALKGNAQNLPACSILIKGGWAKVILFGENLFLRCYEKMVLQMPMLWLALQKPSKRPLHLTGG
jgi:hypothetical protein